MAATVPSPPLEAHSDWSDLRVALRIQARVVTALVLREVRTRFWKNRLGYVWAIVEPCLHVATWFAFFVMLQRQRAFHEMSSLLFLASGIVPFFMFRRVASYLAGSILSNQGLLQFPLVRHVDLMIARFLLEASTLIVIAVIIFGGLIVSGQANPPAHLLSLMGVVGTLLLLGFGFGCFNAVFTLLSSTYANCLGFVNRVLYMTAGVFFLPEHLPPPLVSIARVNPLFHGVDLFRQAYSRDYRSLVGSIWYVMAWGTGLLLMGLVLERAARHRLRQ